MLEKIFGSKARVKLLKSFLMNPDEKFYIRQLSRDLNLQVNSVRRELLNLEQFGLLSSNNNSTNNAFLSSFVDVKNENEDESADLILDQDLLANEKKTDAKKDELDNKPRIRDKKFYQVNKNFILFSELRSLMIKSQILLGESFIKNLKEVCEPKFILLGGMFLNNEGAPTDVLIVADVDKSHLLKIISDLESELNKEINFTCLSEEEFKYRQEVADLFLHSVLNSKKIILLDKILNIKK